VIVRITKRAQAQIDLAARWWDENRIAAPAAFDEDLAEAFLLLGAQPRIGARVTSIHTYDVRCLQLVRIRYSLYYRIRSDRVEVLALWHSSRGVEPNLP